MPWVRAVRIGLTCENKNPANAGSVSSSGSGLLLLLRPQPPVFLSVAKNTRVWHRCGNSHGLALNSLPVYDLTPGPPVPSVLLLPSRWFPFLLRRTIASAMTGGSVTAQMRDMADTTAHQP